MQLPPMTQATSQTDAQSDAQSNDRAKAIIFVDTEVNQEGKVCDYGAVNATGQTLHTSAVASFTQFITGNRFLCGHNLIAHDLTYIAEAVEQAGLSIYIDTLSLSPLLFPRHPYHALVKDDKLQTDERNNPLNDAKKAMQLFYDEVNAFAQLPPSLQAIFCNLLYDQPLFHGFFVYLDRQPPPSRTDPAADLAEEIQAFFTGKLCLSCDMVSLAQQTPIELAYCLALIATNDHYSIPPYWVHRNFPAIERTMHQLRNVPCQRADCSYCHERFDLREQLKRTFDYDDFRTYDKVPLQEQAVRAAVYNESLLVVFPTGGGKSITFQLPALIAGETTKGLTVVISPLQSLMKDQVDNLQTKGIFGAVMINHLLSPLERAAAIEQVQSGRASLLYISPESLRSSTIERLFLMRHIVRFVIDEAHCFSAWGQDFRVDYLYIGDFIRELQEKKQLDTPIPVSCFTATAKQAVIHDIQAYFEEKLGLTLQLFTTNAPRTNLQYEVLTQENNKEKYEVLRRLIVEKHCPTIVYVSRVKRTWELAQQLVRDGIQALPFNGKMESVDKQRNQQAFIHDQVQVMVATSAFGMGVDKPNVQLVIHYDIADSLENYVQEAGRAGRNPNLKAECYILFQEGDLDKHFIFLNQTKLSIHEIQQVWKAIKDFTKTCPQLCRSALEIARQAGWDDTVSDMETRIKSAVLALENAGYIKRGKNVPHIYATSILVSNMAEASAIIEQSPQFDGEKEKQLARRIMTHLFSSRSTAPMEKDEAESRVDYLSDLLGETKADVIHSIDQMREQGILAKTKDMTAYIHRSDTKNKSSATLNKYVTLERFLLEQLKKEGQSVFLKEWNERALNQGVKFSTVNRIKTVFYYWMMKGYIQKSIDAAADRMKIIPQLPLDTLKHKRNRCFAIAEVVIEELYQRSLQAPTDIDWSTSDFWGSFPFADSSHANPANPSHAAGSLVFDQKEDILVLFSVLELKTIYEQKQKEKEKERERKREREQEKGRERKRTPSCFADEEPEPSGSHRVSNDEIEDALLYLSKIDAMKLEGGFLVLYNGMDITRLELDNKIKYKKRDYRQLAAFYRNRIHQIHIVGEYARRMQHDKASALQFVSDYFQKDYKEFLHLYFSEERLAELERNITPEKYNKLFYTLSPQQRAIIEDKDSRCIVVAAGPGSGKTRLLVHKLASLLLLEDVKHEQMLMVTFSRAAATEFKTRLYELIGNAASFVEIKTFHSYCFDLLGKIGSLDNMETVVHDAAQMIHDGEVEQGRITKTVIVIDEAQDMDTNEFALITALLERNDDIRLIAVGDDDQNIYAFRGSDTKYLRSFLQQENAQSYELLENYRSGTRLVALTNAFAATIPGRMKQHPIVAVRDDPGEVVLIRHTSAHLETPVVEDVLRSYDGTETVCVLTNTNREALRVVGLFNQRGQRVRLIQSNDGFLLYNLAEIRYFLKQIQPESDSSLSSIIDNTLWEDAKTGLKQQYATSACLPICLDLLQAFENATEHKYRTDFDSFLRESKLEDFCHAERNTIWVSTIHKSKGREFDQVYLLLDHVSATTAEEKRKIYVGITRAKSKLHIHYNNDLFDGLFDHLSNPAAFAPEADSLNRIGEREEEDEKDERNKRNKKDVMEGIERRYDDCIYAPPEEVMIQLGFHDVVLDCFKAPKKKRWILQRMRSGTPLLIRPAGLAQQTTMGPVEILRFSRKFLGEMQQLQRDGYEPYQAVVRFIVAWQGKEDTTESAVVLPDVSFRRVNRP